MLAAPVHAGQIFGKPQAEPSPEVYVDWRGSGFGGWNLDNIDVKIVDVDTGDAVKVDPVSGLDKEFDKTDGSYDEMVDGDTFISVVNDDLNVQTGVLHGKDWPVGEPSGLKVLTHLDFDGTISRNRPASCLMSTSYYPYSADPANYADYDPATGEHGDYIGEYPETDGFLDSDNPNPTLCNSPFQTHKRFKVDATTPTATTTVAEPIDLVFNTVAGETDVRRYMVLQKLNNYSDRRFTGYTLEVGFGVGSDFQTVAVYDAGIGAVNDSGTKNLTLSLGLGEDEGVDIWGLDDLASFSAGLFGTADDNHHPENGFFDTDRAGYNVSLDETETKIISGEPLPSLLSPSNYVKIFGDWLPSKWAPQGIFWDDDNDPSTDAQLVAFWGVAPGSTEAEQWLLGNEDGFAPVPEATLIEWATNTEGTTDDGINTYSLYRVGEIEDVLNLGLTYIVEVGDVDTFPGTQFTIRMTPIASADTTVPSWVSSEPTPLEDYIPEPVVPEVPVAPVASSGGGGCVANPNAKFDPMLPAMLLSALGYLGFRRRQSAHKIS